MKALMFVCFGLYLVLAATVVLRLLWALVTGFRMGFGRRLGALARSRSLWLSVAAALLLIASAQVFHTLDVLGREGAARTGERAPDLASLDMDGEPVVLGDYRGRHLLIYFWHTRCAPCTAGLPKLRALHAMHAPQRLDILGIAYDSQRAQVEEFIRLHELPWRQIADGADNEGRIHLAYGIDSFPTYLLIGPDGTVERTDRGMVDVLLERGPLDHRGAMERLGLWIHRHTR